MEAKSLIRVLKMQRGRYSKNPNAESEKKAIESIVEKNGGKLEVMTILKENGDEELTGYVRKVLGIAKVKVTETPEKELGESKNGVLYEIDTVKKTCKKILKDFTEINPDDLSLAEMSMTTYQRYLKDNFPGESATIKKGKLIFRGYRISCDAENGFLIEDSTKRYAVVETGFEGIPTPKELGEWFKKPRVEHTPEELKEAVERGKELARKAKEEAEKNARSKELESEEPDYEKCRRSVLKAIKDIRSKTIDFDPTKFPEMIPFKRWKRAANSLLSQWKNRKIRYTKFLNELERITTEETFEVKEKNHRSSFKGTLMPEHDTVGSLVGNKIVVDGKSIDAVPFLLEYLLCVEPRAMAQIMKFANGDITINQLIKNPIEQDWKIEYDKRALENTEFNATALCMVYDSLDITVPQDILYGTGLQVGDKIAIMLDGELKTKIVTAIDKGVFLGKSTGYLLKHDKWFKIEK